MGGHLNHVNSFNSWDSRHSQRKEKGEVDLTWDLSRLRFLASHSRSLDLSGLSFAHGHRWGFFRSRTSLSSDSIGLLLLREDDLGLSGPRREEEDLDLS